MYHFFIVPILTLASVFLLFLPFGRLSIALTLFETVQSKSLINKREIQNKANRVHIFIIFVNFCGIDILPAGAFLKSVKYFNFGGMRRNVNNILTV